jgi:two-component system cell cycle sensor histidine kinase/response regulator CckA
LDDALLNRMTMTNSPDPPIVLVIDDNEVIRSILHSLLSHSGYRVLQAADGDKGIALYRDHHDVVSLVLLDVQMPRKNGMETLKELRKINPAVRCLLMTGDMHHDEVVQAEAAGLMAKPFSASSLFTALEKAGLPPLHPPTTPAN